MSNSWNEFCAGAGRFFDKLAGEAVRLTDAAGMQIRLENIRSRLEKEYATLGKLTYAKLNGGSDNAEQIEASLSRIAELRKTEKEIERDIKEAKAEKPAAKKPAAKKAAKASGFVIYQVSDELPYYLL